MAIKPTYAVLFRKLPFSDTTDYVCVPSTWIIKQKSGLLKLVAAVYPPDEDPHVTRGRAQRNERPGMDWHRLLAFNEYESDSFEDAECWIASRIGKRPTEEHYSDVRDAQPEAVSYRHLGSGFQNLRRSSQLEGNLHDNHREPMPEIPMKRPAAPAQTRSKEEIAEKSTKVNDRGTNKNPERCKRNQSKVVLENQLIQRASIENAVASKGETGTEGTTQCQRPTQNKSPAAPGSSKHQPLTKNKQLTQGCHNRAQAPSKPGTTVDKPIEVIIIDEDEPEPIKKKRRPLSSRQVPRKRGPTNPGRSRSKTPRKSNKAKRINKETVNEDKIITQRLLSFARLSRHSQPYERLHFRVENLCTAPAQNIRDIPYKHNSQPYEQLHFRVENLCTAPEQDTQDKPDKQSDDPRTGFNHSNYSYSLPYPQLARMSGGSFRMNNVDASAAPQNNSSEPTPLIHFYVIPPTSPSKQSHETELSSNDDNPVYQNLQTQKTMVDNMCQTYENLKEEPLSPHYSDECSDHEVDYKMSQERVPDEIINDFGCAVENIKSEYDAEYSLKAEQNTYYYVSKPADRSKYCSTTANAK